jgi:hypothetical protein
MTEVAVIVPWRPSEQRARAWSWLRSKWQSAFPDWPVVEGGCPDGQPWSKGAAVSDGIRRSAAAVLVIADADVWTDGVAEAVTLVASGQTPWATPHHEVRRLSAAATDDVLNTGLWPTVRTSTTYAERPYPAHPGGGMTVLTRDGYNRAPMDPRFEGWGQEDDAWAIALRLLLGREHRGTADLWHLWHEQQPRQSRSIGSADTAALHRRYVQARGSQQLMEQLIAETAPARV